MVVLVHLRFWPLTSEKSTTPVPPGLTSSMFTSWMRSWLRRLNVIVMFVIQPARPETVLVEGYGLAAPAVFVKPGMVIGAVWANRV